MVSAVRRQKIAKAKAAAKAAALAAAAAGDVTIDIALPNEEPLKPLVVTNIVPSPIVKPATISKKAKKAAAKRKRELSNLETKNQNVDQVELKKPEDKGPETVDKAEGVDDGSFGEPFKTEPRFYLTEGCALPANWSYAVLFGKRRDVS